MQSCWPCLSFVSAVFYLTAVAAAPHQLSGSEIKALFNGNTVHGKWGETEYWSYFAPDGWTSYKSLGAPSQNGRWGVNAPQYCSKWPTNGESCYNILADGKTIVWEEPSSHRRYASELLSGNQMLAN